MIFKGLAAAISAALGVQLQAEPAARVQGGCSTECFRWHSATGPLFVKVAAADRAAMLQAESAGLAQLRRAQAVRVPQVLSVAENSTAAWLVLEWIERGERVPASDAALGTQLAAQHRCTAANFGWSRDNTIGNTAQLNGWCAQWTEFVRERRLRYQLQLAAANGHGGLLQRRGELLLEQLDNLFSDYRPLPALLHGDLWGGNWSVDQFGQPVIFDPAVYYGDREADLAMTRLFGGFSPEFYRAYDAAWAPDAGAHARVDLYNLYHVLNHLNLFGAGYRLQALAMLDALLSQLGH